MDLSVSRIDTGRHPTITPFRLSFILVTGGLGIGKAILVSKGEAMSSTTLEWIVGVVLALIFQFLGSYEYSASRNHHLDWFFCYDILRRVLPQGNRIRAFAISSSALHTGATSTITDARNGVNPVPVSGYRLMVSISMAAFGISKMVCAYIGLPTAMNTLDWIISVPLTLILYLIGLYEDVDRNMNEEHAPAPRKLFDVDYSLEAVGIPLLALLAGAYLGCLALCIIWLIRWSSGLIRALDENIILPVSQIPGNEIPDNVLTRACATLYVHLVKGAIVLFYVLMLEVGFLVTATILWPLLRRVCDWRPFFKSKVALHYMFGITTAIYLTAVLLLLFITAVDIVMCLPEFWPLSLATLHIFLSTAENAVLIIPLLGAIICIVAIAWVVKTCPTVIRFLHRSFTPNAE